MFTSSNLARKLRRLLLSTVGTAFSPTILRQKRELLLYNVVLVTKSALVSETVISRGVSPRRLIGTAILFCAVALASPCMQGQRGGVRTRDDNARFLGKSTYASACAGCHGLDGRGTERAPNISSMPSLSDTRIAGIISNGIPGTGMPGFHSFNSAQVRSIVIYLRSLQRKSNVQASLGNAELGRNLFFGKGGCSFCHAIGGKGGFLGPNLTSDITIAADNIRDAIVNPKRAVRSGYRRAIVTTPSGEKIQGIVRNEDNFSVQLLDEEGTFHFFHKSELKAFEYSEEPYMPSDYGKRLTPAEVDDLVSFLTHFIPSGKTKSAQWENLEE